MELNVLIKEYLKYNGQLETLEMFEAETNEKIAHSNQT
jgi:hypothetical protein